MAYMGSEATRLDAPERGRHTHGGPALEVVEGAGLDAEVRRGITRRFWGLWRAGIALAVCLACLFGARVAVLSAAVSVLSENSSMRSQLKQANAQLDGLQIERSVLASNSRVERIATQTYGMVEASGTEQMSAQGTGSDSGGAASSDSADAGSSTKATGSDAGSGDDRAAAAAAPTEPAQADIATAAQSAGDGSAAGSIAADADGAQGL